uniref:thymidine kinase, cytosolic-like n=1 Tax=Styela clava TaxID=7725 RepID=UPI001939F291|nr:thymidine kinase, cytosolic-like [Styela clava]
MPDRVNLIRILAGRRLLLPLAGCQQKRSCGVAQSGIASRIAAGNPITMSCLSISGLSHSPTKNRGQIQVILGPMFSGKSTELMRRIQRYKYANHECLLIKYAKDSRYSDDFMSTHDKHMLPAVKTEVLSKVSIPLNCSVIGIDEGQFFPDIVEFCETMANNGLRVIVAALDGTFQRKGFGSFLSLIPLAESVVKLNAVCMMCYGEAAFTKRIGCETQVEIIGGSDKYMAVCRDCHKQDHKESPLKRIPLGELDLNKQQDTTPETNTGDGHKKISIPRQLLFTKS